MIAGTHNGKTNEEIIAMLVQSLLLAHKHLINCGTSPATVNLPVECALLTAGVDAQTLVRNYIPPAPGQTKPLATPRAG